MPREGAHTLRQVRVLQSGWLTILAPKLSADMIWDAASGVRLGSLNVGSAVFSVQFCPSGDTIAAACNAGTVSGCKAWTVRIIDVLTAQVKRPLKVEGEVQSVVWGAAIMTDVSIFSPRRDRLAPWCASQC